MFIIDKNKDYYDYLSHIYGVDKKVTFDRRGSVVLEDTSQLLLTLFDGRDIDGVVKKKKIFWDRDYKLYFILETGSVQYLFSVDNVEETKSDDIHFSVRITKVDVDLVHVFKENKNFFGSPLSLRKVRVEQSYAWKERKYRTIITDFKSTVKPSDKEIKLPIFSNTKIPAIIPAMDIWQNISTYISSLKTEKDVDIPLTDKDKLINHGFDTKTSFRHPVK